MALSLISLILSSVRALPLQEFIKSACDNCRDPSRVEIIIVIDRDNEEMLNVYNNTNWRGCPIKINFIVLDNPKGYFGGGHRDNTGVMASLPDSYFVQIVNDKLRFTCKNWDDKYMSYKNSFDDDVFVVRMSSNKDNTQVRVTVPGSHNLSSFHLLQTPENFRLYTKKMYNLLEGAGDYWATDTWHEPILAYLEELHHKNRQIKCDVEIFDKAGEEVGTLNSDPNKYDIAGKRMIELDQPQYHTYTYKRIAKKISDYITIEGLKRDKV